MPVMETSRNPESLMLRMGKDRLETDLHAISQEYVTNLAGRGGLMNTWFEFINGILILSK